MLPAIENIDHMRRGMKITWTEADGRARTGSVVTQADLPRMSTRLSVLVDGGQFPVSAESLFEGGLRPRLVTAIDPPKVLNARKLGRTMPAAVYVGRPSEWGNPFVLGRHGDRDQVMDRYIAWLHENPDFVLRVRQRLAGKDLVCWCDPEACHGHVLRDLAMGAPLPRIEPNCQPDLFPGAAP